jgi:hypothetical protein
MHYGEFLLQINPLWRQICSQDKNRYSQKMGISSAPYETMDQVDVYRTWHNQRPGSDYLATSFSYDLSTRMKLPNATQPHQHVRRCPGVVMVQCGWLGREDAVTDQEVDCRF